MQDNDLLSFEALAAIEVKRLALTLSTHAYLLSVAESCTGGLLAQVLTAQPGSSNWFERGFITYSNLAKQQMLNVSADCLEQQGAVSEATARAMAEGAILQSAAHFSIAVTGIAGPSSDESGLPIGTVWLAWCRRATMTTHAECRHFSGDRQAVRQQAVLFALQYLTSITDKHP